MIAYLGTGLLGSNFVRALLSRGETVHVWNRSPDKAHALEKYGARAFDDPAEAVRGAERVHLTLSDDSAVDGVLERARAGFSDGGVVREGEVDAFGAADGRREIVERTRAILL